MMVYNIRWTVLAIDNISLLIHYSRSICKLLYYRDLHLERWKSDDVVSQKNGEDEKLTFLTIFS